MLKWFVSVSTLQYPCIMTQVDKIKPFFKELIHCLAMYTSMVIKHFISEQNETHTRGWFFLMSRPPNLAPTSAYPAPGILDLEYSSSQEGTSCIAWGMKTNNIVAPTFFTFHITRWTNITVNKVAIIICTSIAMLQNKASYSATSFLLSDILMQRLTSERILTRGLARAPSVSLE